MKAKNLGLKILLIFILAVIFFSSYSAYFFFKPHTLGLNKNITESDLPAFYTAAQMVKHNVNNIYNLNNQYYWQKIYFPEKTSLTDLNPYRNPPFAILLYLPLANFSPQLAYYIVLVFNLLIFCLIIYLIFILSLKTNLLTKIILILLILTYSPILVVFYLGQTSFLLVLSLLLFLWLSKQNKPLLSGIALSLLSIKPQYLPLTIIFLLIQKKFKSLTGLTIGVLILLLISTLIVGVPGIVSYQNFLQAMLQNLDAFQLYPRAMFTLQSFIMDLAHTDSVSAIRSIWLGAEIVTLLIFWLARKGSSKLFFSVFILVLILTSPYVNLHDLSLLIIVAIALLNWQKTSQNQVLKQIIWEIIIVGYILGISLLTPFLLNLAYLYDLFLILSTLILGFICLKFGNQAERVGFETALPS